MEDAKHTEMYVCTVLCKSLGPSVLPLDYAMKLGIGTALYMYTNTVYKAKMESVQLQ